MHGPAAESHVGARHPSRRPGASPPVPRVPSRLRRSATPRGSEFRLLLRSLPLLVLTGILALQPGCRWLARATTPRSALPTVEPLSPSPRLVLGRILAIDPARGFAHVELASDAPPAAFAEGTELLVRTDDLRETGRLQASRYLRGRILGATIARGNPQPGDEVAWLAP